MTDFALAILAALVCAAGAYVLLRWRDSLAHGMARIQYRISRGRWVRPWRLACSPLLWRTAFFVSALALCVVACGVLVIACTAFARAPAQRSLTPDVEWGTRPGAPSLAGYPLLDATVTLLCGVFFCVAGVYHLAKREWMARIFEWFWRIDLPVEEPYPEHADPSAEVPPKSYARAVMVEVAVLLTVGLLVCLVGLRKLIPLL